MVHYARRRAEALGALYKALRLPTGVLGSRAVIVPIVIVNMERSGVGAHRPRVADHSTLAQRAAQVGKRAGSTDDGIGGRDDICAV